MSRVSDVLRGKGSEVCTISPDAPVSELLAMLAEHNIGAVVVASGDTVVGIVSERDVVRGMHRESGALLSTTVRDIMSSTVVTCGPEDHVDSLMRTMTERRFRHVPVLSDGKLAGIVSIGDVVKVRIGELEDERAHLHSYLATGS
ncbi:MAG TPA: CBS domain-containing protein [Pseudonocardia sp.]|jgi:CBS domain-containing protein|nr:CBS domain-containing protein [Pseudonocardia sp.]